MPTKKSFSVPALTKATEEFINRHKARAHAAADVESTRIYQLHAQGAYLLWYTIASSFVSTAEDDRMKKLLEMDAPPAASD